MVTCLLLGPPNTTWAQENPRPLPATPRDFLFGEPRGEVNVRAGWAVARGRSDWYDFVTRQLTLDRGDFRAFTVGSDVGMWLSPRTTLVVGAEVARTSPASEYRALVDNNRLPISQVTRLVGVSLTGGLKVALAPRGRAIGQLAWIPARVVPFVSAGGGAAFYSLRQTGDFVDVADNAIFAGQFQSTGWAPTYYGGGGIDVRIGRTTQLTVDLRYRHAAARLGSAWVNFEPLDLSGTRVTLGTTWPF